MEDELALFQRIAHFPDQRQLLGQGTGADFLGQHEAALPPLGFVHRQFGPLQQRVEAGAVCRVEGDSQAAVHIEALALDFHRRAQRSEQHLGESLHRRTRHAFKQEGELVAPQPCQHRPRRQLPGQPGADLPQQLVADRMAERIVDRREAVEVEHHHRGQTVSPVMRVSRRVWPSSVW